jgi:hypothetical protein
MKALLMVLIAALLAPVAAAGVSAPPPTRRFAIVAGANRGPADRVALRYAVADADRFAKVVTGMGGVASEDCVVLREPTRIAFLDALAAVKTRADAARATGGRVDVVVYFSGHADDRGLMLGREMLPYTELRSALSEVAADVGITILDACASGAITRLKGGKPHPAFLTDASSQIKGYAFLTSSSENEAAQESERLQGSFFTQALLTGLRGAADVSGDGQVTLGEAYQFAFAETLAQTTSTQGGAQHPAYDIKMAGTGDVVLTDVRQTSAILVLGPDYDGRFFVLGPRRQLVAELFKPYGRTIELGLEPGEYDVYFEQEQKLLSSSVTVREGQRQELVRQEMHPTRRRPTQSRGGSVELPARDLLDGRTRVQIGFGVSGISATSSSTPTRDFVHIGHGWEGASVNYWIRPDVALDLGLGVTDLTVESTPTTDRTSGTFAFLAGARYYPPLSGIVRPFAAAAIGPFDEFNVVDGVTGSAGGSTGTHFGGTVGGGVDVFFGPHFTLGLDGRAVLVTDRSSHFGVTVTFGWIWGGRP